MPTLSVPLPTATIRTASLVRCRWLPSRKRGVAQAIEEPPRFEATDHQNAYDPSRERIRTQDYQWDTIFARLQR